MMTGKVLIDCCWAKGFCWTMVDVQHYFKGCLNMRCKCFKVLRVFLTQNKESQKI